jgi:hypothetical protein
MEHAAAAVSEECRKSGETTDCPIVASVPRPPGGRPAGAMDFAQRLSKYCRSLSTAYADAWRSLYVVAGGAFR